MAYEALIVAITQWGSLLTVIAGIIAVVYTFRAASKVFEGDFKKMIFTSAIFLLLVTLGTAAISFYHFAEDTSYYELGETAEQIWYAFMFLGLLFSLYESWKLIQFGKHYKAK